MGPGPGAGGPEQDTPGAWGLSRSGAGKDYQSTTPPPRSGAGAPRLRSLEIPPGVPANDTDQLELPRINNTQ